MRDIVGHRPPHHHSSQEPAAIPQPIPPTFFERVAERVNQIGGTLNRFGEKSQTEIIGVTPPPFRRGKKVRRLPKGVVTKAGRVVKHAATSAHGELKKPGRKTALVHTLALGALFALVISGNPWAKGSTTPATTPTPASVRRYLPSIQSDTSFAPANISTAAAASGNKQLSTYGWVTPWSVSSGADAPYTSASAFWLTVGSDGATMTPKAGWDVWQTYKQEHNFTDTYLTVSGDPNNTYKALADPTLQSAHIANLLAAVNAQGFSGIDIDYEGLGSQNRDLFTAFIRNLTTIFHQQGRKVAVTVEARIANEVPMNWQALGQLADQIRVMAYDYHSQTTDTPGSIAPLAWVAEVTSYAASQVDPKKLIIGLGNYGYDWTAPLTAGDSWVGTGVSFEQATALSTQYNAPIVQRTGIDDRGYDIGTIPSFTYTDTQNRQHEVWFEDAASLQEKINAVAAYQVGGIMFWSVGDGDPTLLQPSS